MATEHIDIAKTVVERPWAAMAVAVAAGALLGLGQPAPPRTALGRKLLVAVGGVALGLVREAAIQGALGAARSWLHEDAA